MHQMPMTLERRDTDLRLECRRRAARIRIPRTPRERRGCVASGRSTGGGRRTGDTQERPAAPSLRVQCAMRAAPYAKTP